MSRPDVKIIVEKGMSDEEFHARLEDYMQFKLDGLLLCLNCEEIFVRDGAYVCPVCGDSEVFDLWDVNEVTEWGVRSRL